jgi:hypothetical protein
MQLSNHSLIDLLHSSHSKKLKNSQNLKFYIIEMEFGSVAMDLFE